MVNTEQNPALVLWYHRTKSTTKLLAVKSRVAPGNRANPTTYEFTKMPALSIVDYAVLFIKL
jgi:hypothetical protein